jgi:excisionase family DNA binding protein
MAAPEIKRLLTPNEVAELLNVSVAQVYTLLRGNELPGLKIGKRGVWRVDPDQLAAYVDGLRSEALDRVRDTAR